ncbi:MAG: hypothetical protein IH607_00280, partial [Firmicutes bacterium]|nr:hypothetical protein [Bacillota bacterium]
ILFNTRYLIGKAYRLTQQQIDELDVIRQTLAAGAGPLPAGEDGSPEEDTR